MRPTTLSSKISARGVWVHAVLGPVLVSAGYYFGAEVGFALQSPNAPQSVLWLPNSILLAILLIVPYRTWPAYLLAAFPAQMLVGWGAGQPPLAMALLFVTNCLDAALGASLVRRALGVEEFRFDGLRSTIVFACGASIATILLSFADARVSVATGFGDSAAAAFSTRVRSNILTHLIVVPAILDMTVVNWRRIRPARLAEAAALVTLLTLSCGFVFGRSAGWHAFPAVINLPLPLLLWAAARFGPGGVGCGALFVAGVASWNALHSRGPFASGSPLDEVVSLQLFLLASAVPLLFLAAVVRERNRATGALRASALALGHSYSRVRALAGKLMTAQEMERARIARDMHDDFNQQLAALAIELGHLRDRPPAAAELDDTLAALYERTVALTDQVRSFSHDLHPALLGHVGLPAALRAHCTRLAEQQGLQVSFTHSTGLSTIPREAATCMYRIVQEGLRNVASHAGVRDASVSLVRMDDSVELTIVDRGRGFEPESFLSSGAGLGLLSMEERARAAGGSLTIISGHGEGTTLQVCVPVAGTT